MRRIARALLIATLLGGSGQGVLGQATSAAEAGRPGTPSGILVRIDCYSSPERVIITNDRARTITIRSVGSAQRRRAGEPYRTGKALGPGKHVVYTFGTGKGGKRLSRSFIFDNESSREAVLVRTSKGRVRVRCVDGSNVPASSEERPPDEGRDGVVVGQDTDALLLLAGLIVEPETEGGYDRGLFEHWIDADSDGCDTRQEVLIAESLTPVTIGEGCRIEGGTWLSAPDGDTITNPASVDINHTVPLREAWDSGAYAWSPERRRAFANDLLDGRTLQGVSAGSNRQQGENDPASWLPADRDVACRFVADWVAIKSRWRLSVDAIEHDAIETTLASCPDRVVTVLPRSPDGQTLGE